ncbi:MAG TPA: hypothetical protein DD379_07905, partial [Cyanobacteria bacterium UBA11162]|nr:hypothetical protein [Cyanobacteria bacterium UBA11162]
NPNNPNNPLQNRVTSFVASKVGTIVVAPGKRLRNNVTAFINQKRQSNKGELKIFARSASISIVTIIGVFSLAKLVSQLPQFPTIQFPKISLPSQGDQSVSRTEQSRLEKIIKRRQALKIDPVVFNQNVDQLFYAQHPELQNRSLTNNPEDAKFRQDWYQIAEDLLDKVERGESL